MNSEAKENFQARSDFDIKGMQPSIQNQIQPNASPMKTSNGKEIYKFKFKKKKKIYIVVLKNIQVHLHRIFAS